MTCAQKQTQLWEHFRRVSLLSDHNGCQVLRVRHKALGTDYVLHILPTANSVYTTLCHIRHLHLPAVYEVWELSDGMMVLEEYIDALTIAQICETGRYRKRGAIRVAAAICEALAVLHDNGIIHRDVKPENVMIDKFGRVVLIDFNAARRLSAKSQDTVIMGTVGYAPPEQLGLSQSDERTDLYALGVLLNVMLTGVHPNERIAAGAVGRVVRKCTQINSDERFRSARELQKKLLSIGAGR